MLIKPIKTQYCRTDGDSFNQAANLLLEHPYINTSNAPNSAGAVEQSIIDGQANLLHCGNPKYDTADFADSAPGNLRADYVLPSANLEINDSGVYWPVQVDPDHVAVGTFPFPSSDHKLVWVDILM